MNPDTGLTLRRKITNRVMTVLFMFAAAVSVGALVAILWKLTVAGVGALSPAIILQGTPSPGSKGGLLNPILGSAFMTLIAIVAATPIAVLAGTYLAEYGRRSRLGQVVRFLNDTLLSAPSIIIGLFIYGVVVVPAGHFSAWAGAAALALIALPVVVRTTEDMLRLIPDTLREAAVALGCPYWRMVVSIGWRAARPGILTGVLLAVARISGETAPLLFTSLNNQFVTTNMNAPMASLPVVIFQFAMSPYRDWQALAWAGALLITFSVLLLNVIARSIVSRSLR
jgi:phosphate transport system permease protein